MGQGNTRSIHRAGIPIPTSIPKLERHVLRLAKVQRRLSAEYLGRLDDRDIVGFGVGSKMVDGVLTEDEAIVFMVRTKFGRTSKRRLPRRIFIPDVGESIQTDVWQVGEDIPTSGGADNQLTHRPVPGGVSISRVGRTSRTHGVRVVSTNRDDFMLTASHDDMTIGEKILQKGAGDGGLHPRELAGHVADTEWNNVAVTGWSTIRLLGNILTNQFFVDGAIIAPIKPGAPETAFGGATPAELEDYILHFGVPAGPLSPYVPRLLAVKKDGRTTGATFGYVLSPFYTTLYVDQRDKNNMKKTIAHNVIVADIRIEEGDSGSVLLSRASYIHTGVPTGGGNYIGGKLVPITAGNRGVGLLFNTRIITPPSGQTFSVSLACHLHAVLARFKVSLP